MLFNSVAFVLFFPVVTILYFLLPHKLRWFHLLVVSCLFYMTFIPVYILILFAIIIIDYVMAIMIEKGGSNRRLYLGISIAANLGILIIFKYYNFFISNVNHLIPPHGTAIPLLAMVLPIGLSFHTFQAMSYTIEVYRGNVKAERHLGIYSLYVMFYPQLIAGPIERPQNMLHQFHERRDFNYADVVAGLRQMLWGMIKKVVIADRLALFVDQVYGNCRHYSGIALFITAIFFTFQVYCDFSGYSDIAIGSAKVMGFDLMKNFDRPFASRSISEFWTRWHISLSTWFFDYLFNPLVASLRSWRRWAIVIGLMVTFLISGFWHGASWNFIIWGGLYGIALVYEFFTRPFRQRIFEHMPRPVARFIGVAFTFLYVVFASVFFRVTSFSDSIFIVKKLAGIPRELMRVLTTGRAAFLHLPPLYTIGAGFLLIILLELTSYLSGKFGFRHHFSARPAYLRWALYITGPLVIYWWGVFDRHDFIYFQF